MQSSSGGGGGVISALCRVWGPKGVAPTQRPIDASSRHWFWEVWGEYLENILVLVLVLVLVVLVTECYDCLSSMRS